MLYAEDDIVIRAVYKDYFEQHFKTVYLAENGQQALDVYTQKKPDVVFLDIMMPVFTGLDVCKEIRKNDNVTKIILFTGRSDKEALLTAIELGLTSYLEKPVSNDTLEQLLVKLSNQFEDIDKYLIRQSNDKYFTWDKNQRELFCNSEHIHLTKNEKLLLELFISSRHEKIDYQQIFDHVWFGNNDKEFSELSIKTLLKRLRDKLPPDTFKNTYGLGYFLNKSTDKL